MKQYVLFLILALAVIFSLSAGNTEVASAEPQEAQALTVPGHLVDSEWLKDNLEIDELVILDTARSEDDFNSGHISGARYAPREGYWTEVNGIPGMFPGVGKAASWLESLGVSNDSAVIIYDAGAGLWAARIAWTLAYLGHDDWAVLDGGYAYWVDEDYPVVSGDAVQPAKGKFNPSVRPELLVSADEIVDHLDNPDFVVVDTRSPKEYSGEDVRGARGGHIPGSLPLEWTLNNSGSPARMLPADQLAEFYVSEGVQNDSRVVTLCQTGVRGAHTWLALTLAGYSDVALYDGSWAEWAANESYPLER